MKLCAGGQQNSFISCLKEGLEKIGVTNSLNEISVLTGSAFAPAVVTNVGCFSAGVQKADEVLIDNMLESAGLKCERLEIKPAAWKRATFRRYFRELITESIEKNNLALVQGGWEFPASSYDWGIVESIGKKGALAGKVNGKISLQVSAPSQLFIVSVSNNFNLSGQKEKILLTASGLLNNINSNDNLITGTKALEYFADLTHRQPLCLECKKESSACAGKFLEKYSENLKQGIEYLGKLEKKNENLENAIKEFSIILEQLKDLEADFEDLESQSESGELIRKLIPNQKRAAVYLSLYCDVPCTVPEVEPVFDEGNKIKKLAKSLPLYKDLKDGKSTFLCSILIAGQVAGIEIPPAWLKFCSGIPFKFLINRKTFMPPKDNLQGIDSSEPLFEALGYDYVKYFCGEKDSEDAGGFIKQAIKKTIERGYPLIVYQTNGWGILAGYSGDNFLCRFPGDSDSRFSYTDNIPEVIFEFGEKQKEFQNREKVKRALSRIIEMNEKTNAGEFVSGTAGLQFWIDKCSYYLDNKIYPPVEFAEANYKLWTKLLKNRREAYQSMDFIGSLFPELTIPFGFIRKNYLEEVNILKCGLADGIVLNYKNGKFTKKNWLPEKAKEQIEALEKIKSFEEDNLLHFKIAFKQMGIQLRRPGNP